MKQQWIFFALVFFSLVSTDDNCYKKNLCYGRDSGALCANVTTLVGCSQWQDYPVQCPYGCVQKNAGEAQCGCLNNCSGIGICSGGTCSCPGGYSGVDCSVKSVCIGLNNGYYCINDTYIDCINQQPVYQIKCDLGCSSSGCYCPNNCSGFPCGQYGSCQCPTNRTGPDCSIVNPCTPTSSGRQCLNATTSVLCSGTYLYSLVNCPYSCSYLTGYCSCSSLCKDHGSCSDGSCYCDSGYYGTSCEHTSPCYQSQTYGYSCRGNQRVYCSSIDYDVTVTNCSTACVTEYGYSQCECACDTSHDKFSVCGVDGSCSCSGQWQGPHCWNLPLGLQHGFCAVPDGTYCNGTSLVTCSGNYPRSTQLCIYGCKQIGFGGEDRCGCPIGPNGLECSGAGTCAFGQCYCLLGVRGFDCSPDPCREAGVDSGTICLNSYTAAQCIGGNMVTKNFCSAGCEPQGGQSKCNMQCGPNGTSLGGSCKCAKGYSACPPGFRGDTCNEPISACTFTNGTAPVTTCDGSQALTCVNHVAVSASVCTEGCLNGKCMCNRENSCSGHGNCLDGVCECDVGWTGVNCQEKQLAACERKPNGRYCGNNNETAIGEVFWCFKEIHVGSQACPGLCSEETAKCLCPFNCHGHGDCNDGTCFCKGLWFGPHCKYSGFTITLQIIGAIALLAGILLGFFMVTSYNHTRKVPMSRLDQARKTDYDFSEEEVVLVDSHVEGYQSMGRNVFKRLFKKQ